MILGTITFVNVSGPYSTAAAGNPITHGNRFMLALGQIEILVVIDCQKLQKVKGC